MNREGVELEEVANDAGEDAQRRRKMSMSGDGWRGPMAIGKKIRQPVGETNPAEDPFVGGSGARQCGTEAMRAKDTPLAGPLDTTPTQPWTITG